MLTREGTVSLPKIVAYAPAIFWAGGLLWLGSRSFQPFDLPNIVLPPDKLAHLLLYGMLGLLSVLGWRWAGRQPSVWIPLVAALIVGALDELKQRGVPARTAELYDWLVDALAICIAFLALGRPARHVSDE